MLQIDCRGARRRAGMTQEAWADAVGLSLDRVRSLEYRQGQFPGWDAAYRMALLGQFLRLDGPDGPMALTPLELVVHPEAQHLPLTVLEPVPGQTHLWGTPVLLYARMLPRQSHEAQGRRLTQLTLV